MLTNTNIIYKQKRYSIGFGKHRLFEHFNKKLLLYLDKSIPFICPFFSTDDVCGVRDKIFCKVQFRHQRTWTLNNELEDSYDWSVIFIYSCFSLMVHHSTMGKFQWEVRVTFRFLFKFANFGRKYHFHLFDFRLKLPL